jgi:hypothetical protein
MWVHIGGELVCYETTVPKDTEEGVIYHGTAKARLNGEEEIQLLIEWEPVSEVTTQPANGRITGYYSLEEEHPFMKKGANVLESGDTLDFLFDYYDEQGEYIKTEAYGNTVRVISMDRLTVRDEPLPAGEVQYFGILTDAFQRELMTETVTASVEDID